MKELTEFELRQAGLRPRNQGFFFVASGRRDGIMDF